MPNSAVFRATCRAENDRPCRSTDRPAGPPLTRGTGQWVVKDTARYCFSSGNAVLGLESDLGERNIRPSP